MKSIQDIVNSGGNLIELPVGEFKGPLIIDKPCTVKGNCTTLWNNDGTVIDIRSQGVRLQNIRAEITSNNDELHCICSYFEDTEFENVEISGAVKGVRDEELQWIMPKSIFLGDFKAENINTYQMEIYVPLKSEVSCDVSGIKISPSVLEKGRNTVFIETENIKNKVFIYGEILIKSIFTRRIYISGRCFSDAPLNQNVMLYNAAEPEPQKNIPTDFSKVYIPDAQSADNKKISSIQQLYRGERININHLAADTIKIEFNCRKMYAELDIDPYVFLIDSDERVFKNDDFIFFSNPVSSGYGVRIQQGKNRVNDVEIDLNNIQPYVEKISIVYSVYPTGSAADFSQVNEPFVTVRSGENIKYLFSAENLITETTVVFLQFFRHGNSWIMETTGAGYRYGLSRLCESYGLKVGY